MEFLKYFLQMSDMVLLCFTIDDYIIQVEYHQILQVVNEKFKHCGQKTLGACAIP